MSAQRHAGLLRDQRRLTGLLAGVGPSPAGSGCDRGRAHHRAPADPDPWRRHPAAITSIFKEMLGLDTLAFGFSMPDEDAHAPNEFFRISSLLDGLREGPMLLAELARYKPGDFRMSA